MQKQFREQDDNKDGLDINIIRTKTKNLNYVNEKVKNIIIYLVLFILGFNFLAYRAYNLESIKNYLRISASLLLMCFILINLRKIKFSRKELVLVWYMGVILLINGINTFNFVFIVFFAIFTKNALSDNLSKAFNKINLILLFMLVCSLMTGMLHNIQYVSSLGRIRSMLGFNNPNPASLFFFSVAVTFVLSKRNDYAKRLLIALALNILIYSYTGARTMLVGFVFFTIFYFMFALIFKFKNIAIIYYMVKLLVVFVVCMSFFSGYILEKFPQLDQFMSYRLSIFSNYINKNSTLNFLFGGTKLLEIDNFYLVFLYNYGILLFVIISLLILKAVGKLFVERNKAKLAFVLTMLLIGLTESSIIRPEIICVLVFWKIVFQYSFVQNSELDLQAGGT